LPSPRRQTPTIGVRTALGGCLQASEPQPNPTSSPAGPFCRPSTRAAHAGYPPRRPPTSRRQTWHQRRRSGTVASTTTSRIRRAVGRSAAPWFLRSCVPSFRLLCGTWGTLIASAQRSPHDHDPRHQRNLITARRLRHRRVRRPPAPGPPRCSTARLRDSRKPASGLIVPTRTGAYPGPTRCTLVRLIVNPLPCAAPASTMQVMPPGADEQRNPPTTLICP
jgi:hypothetical protein